MCKLSRVGCLISVLCVAGSWPVSAEINNSSYVNSRLPMEVFWGDTHLHTSLSLDAYFRGTRLNMEEAYRFAKGETVHVEDNRKVHLRRPLDFLAITDHAFNLGLMVGLSDRDRILKKTDAGRNLLRQFEKIKGGTAAGEFNDESRAFMINAYGKNLVEDGSFSRSVWEKVIDEAERNNDPGKFTTFIAFEWTPEGTGGTGNLHRNILFRDGQEKARQVLPFSKFDSGDPEDLWRYLEEYEKKTGGQVLAIPHGGNVSNGEMFALRTVAGEELTRDYAETRQRWEPLYEVTQIKGDSESHPFLSPYDEFADFEIWNSWYAKNLPVGRTWNEEERERKQGEYARSALKRGLGMQANLGINPFKFGFAGGTDAHTSLSAVDENNFWGANVVNHPSEARLGNNVGEGEYLSSREAILRSFGVDPLSVPRPPYARELASAGYTAVWATENTREALFDAMKRKETYATTGPRMTVRFFGGWDYDKNDALNPDIVVIGYHKGVPMGGDLHKAPSQKSPSFLIQAAKDPDGANLDRVQVIKGWRSRDGKIHEKIYDVVLSDGRKADPKTGKVPPVGNTVDIRTASYTNSIGAPELTTVWTDPHFNCKEQAFYYLRVLEIPTPRWTTYDAVFFKTDLPDDVPTTIQERAYTSPIWYVP